MDFSQLELELGRLERAAAATAEEAAAVPPLATPTPPTPPMPSMPSMPVMSSPLLRMPSAFAMSDAAAARPPAPADALFAEGVDHAVERLHAAAQDAVLEGVDDVWAGLTLHGKRDALQSLLTAAAAATPPSTQAEAHIDAAARTYAALHPAARSLLHAMADVRAAAVDVVGNYVHADADARLTASLRVWEGARWTTEDAYARTRDLDSRRDAWRDALERSLSARWAAFALRVAELARAWDRVVEQYAAVLGNTCTDPSADVLQFLAGDVEPSGASAGPTGHAGTGSTGPTSASAGKKKDSASAVEAAATKQLAQLRGAVAHFADTWQARDTALRAACLAKADAASRALPAAEAGLAALQAQLAETEAGIAAARRRIVEAHKAQLAQLTLSGGGLGAGLAGGVDGLSLAAALSASHAAAAREDADIEALYARRKEVQEGIAVARGEVERAAAAARADAAGRILATHARWREAARTAAADVAALADEVSLLRVHRTHLLTALDVETAAEHARILESARAAFDACADQAAFALDRALVDVVVSRANALAPLRESEGLLAGELTALVAALSAPPAAVQLVDAAMHAASTDRLSRIHVEALAGQAAALQPIADGLAAGLPKPHTLPSPFT